MKKNVFILLVVVLALPLVVVGNILLYEPPVLDVEYINTEILTGPESVDEILKISHGNNYIACLCSTSSNELMFLIVKNDETYSLHFKEMFRLNTLTQDSAQIKTDKMLFSQADIMYNVFLDPTNDTIAVDGTVQTVHTVQYNGHTCGFWWSEM